MKLLTSLLSITIALSLLQEANSQINASFEIADTIACSGIEIEFRNTTLSPGGSLDYTWDFGNSTSSTDSTGFATYASGNYTVKLYATNGVVTDSAELAITVAQSPSADFNVDDTLDCRPFLVQFEADPIEGDASIASYFWDFGDGENAASAVIGHTYLTGGLKDPSLTVTDANGCYNTITKTDLIWVVRPPSVNFTFDPTASCEIPAPVQFTDASTTEYGTMSYEWDFDDTTTSTDQNPLHEFAHYRTYGVELTVKNNELGCSSARTINHMVLNVVAGGTIDQGGDVKLDSDYFCRGNLDFASTSSGNNEVFWDFGNGFTSTNNTDISNYPTSRPYNISLIASYSGFCPDTLNWTLFADSIRADFNASPENSCVTPTEVTFTDASTKAVDWEYTFQGGDKGYQADTTYHYFLPAEPDQYHINQTNIFTTRLDVTSVNGCTDFITKNISILKPTAAFTSDIVEGCAPLEVTFWDKSSGPVTSYKWLFGDGNDSTTIAAQLSHTYAAEGIYDAKLIIENDESCPDTSYAIQIKVGRAIVPDFNFSSTNACANEDITITNTSAEVGLIDYSYYKIENKIIPAPNPQTTNYVFDNNLAADFYDVELVASYRGCESSELKSNYFQSQGPKTDFRFVMDCSNPLEYNFEAYNAVNDSMSWLYGDGSTDYQAGSLGYHIYSTEGNYNVSLLAYNGVCSDTLIKTIKVRNKTADINAPIEACVGTTVQFDGSASYTINEQCANEYLWNFGDGSQPKRFDTTSNVAHTYNERGNYEISLITNYDNGCIDTAIHALTVFEPYAGFYMDADTGCSPFLVTFTDTSKADASPLDEWKWYFGDNDSLIFTAATHDTFPEHTYTGEMGFDVTLLVIDQFGCFNQVTQSLFSYEPDASFTVDNQFACVNTPIEFTYSYNADSVQWIFDDSTTSTSVSIPETHTYTSGGFFEPGLIVYKYICSDTVFQPTGYIEIEEPNAGYTASEYIANCYPAIINFKLNDTVQSINATTWDMGVDTVTFTNSNEVNFTYTYPGKYAVSLDVVSDNSCSAIFTDTIDIRGPIGSYQFTPDTSCKESPVEFTLVDTADVRDFAWVFEVGDSSRANPAQHVFTNFFFEPQLVLFGDSGCIAPIQTIPVEFYDIVAEFTVENTSGCAFAEIPMNNTSSGNTSSFWDFGNDSTSTLENPVQRFNPGNYVITLIVANDAGCTDTTTRVLEFSDPPTYTITNKVSFLCEGTSMTLGTTGGDSIIWSLDNLTNVLNETNNFNPTFTPSVSSLYIAEIFDAETGCSNLDSVGVVVQSDYTIEVIQYEPDPIVVDSFITDDNNILDLIIGEFTRIESDSLPFVTYTWMPDTAINCSNCANVLVNPLESTEYTLFVSDTNSCFEKEFTVDIQVEEKYKIAMPSAISPLDDTEANRIIYVRGWGIKELVEFSVFNRQGREVFYSDDIEIGWDGYYEGELLELGSYSYIVRVITFDNQEITKQGVITLIR
jgi:PKD repeat protein